jgi:cellulose synthase/poly-beta-1,6-N-acetylglucosamine synthase-like glycosyltransferase
MQELLVTVVVPALNEEKFLARCLRSIKNLEYPSEFIKLIVVDNGSRDKTREIANQYADIVLDIPPKSIANARNAGAAKAAMDIVAFIDADIVVHPKWLANAIPHFSDPQVVAVGSYPDVIQEESNRLQQTWSRLCRSDSDEPTLVEWLPSANLIVRRSAFEQVHGFDENLITCEDSDLGYRLKNIGKVVYVPGALVYHLREPKTFREFFKKEIWHSRGNLTGAFRHGFTLMELPSLVLPALFGAGLTTCVISIFFGLKLLIAGCASTLFPVWLYVGKGRKKAGNTTYIFWIYFVYLGARSLCFYRDLFHLLTCKRFTFST